MQQRSAHIVFFDLETGGLNPRRHPIIQIGAVAVDADLSPIETFEQKVQFDARKANRHSLRKNHFQFGIWAREAIEPRAAARAFAAFLRRHATVSVLGRDGVPYFVAQLAAHNAAFDGPFLQAWFAKLQVYLPANRHMLCTLQRALWRCNERPNEPQPRNLKLATLCQHFGVPLHAAAAHDALADAEATAALYRKMLSPVSRVRLARAG